MPDCDLHHDSLKTFFNALDKRLDRVELRMDRIESKIDDKLDESANIRHEITEFVNKKISPLEQFRWMVLGATLLVSSVVSAIVTYLGGKK